MKRAKRNSIGAPDDASGVTAGRLGRHLVIAGKLTEPDIDRVVALQNQNKSRFGEAAIDLGLVSEEDVQRALSLQYNYPYTTAEVALHPLLVAANHPFSERSEAYRTLRSRLILSWVNDQRQVIAVTSPRSREGSSSLAANLAIVFAQLGERTLLIDANLRNPVQQGLFGFESCAGLSDVLSGRCSMSEAVKDVAPFQNLSLLCAGALPPNPQELLTRVQFSYLIETAPAAFDVVIVDTPPILDFADAQLVASRAGGCIVSARRNRTLVGDMAAVKSRLESTGGQVIGVVIGD